MELAKELKDATQEGILFGVPLPPAPERATMTFFARCAVSWLAKKRSQRAATLERSEIKRR